MLLHGPSHGTACVKLLSSQTPRQPREAHKFQSQHYNVRGLLPVHQNKGRFSVGGFFYLPNLPAGCTREIMMTALMLPIVASALLPPIAPRFATCSRRAAVLLPIIAVGGPQPCVAATDPLVERLLEAKSSLQGAEGALRRGDWNRCVRPRYHRPLVSHTRRSRLSARCGAKHARRHLCVAGVPAACVRQSR